MTTRTRFLRANDRQGDGGPHADPPRPPVRATPTRRPLRVYPYDPELDRRGRSIVADVAFEHTEVGPSGRLVRVVDYDPVRQCFYEPIRLDAPEVLLNRGLDLAVHDPQFHQQMVYAVVMTVLEAFENGLGRPFRWRGNQRLMVVPHAFEGENAFFDEELFALLFGYFRAADNGGANVPGGIVYTCLSHDIIAHETTHAVIHRLRPGYSISTELDVFGFHEGFADIVALLHRFTYPDLVAEQLRDGGARLEGANPLVEFATQFGHAQGSTGPLRSMVEDPSPTAYADATEEHDRGQVLAAAVIDGFLRSYRDDVADLIRLATAGSGVLQPGARRIPILVEQLTNAACAAARNVLAICIRAFDFLPPVSVTFADYLRALVTADFELYPDDDRHYRANLIEAFRVRGIVPKDVASLADLSLRLEPCRPDLFREPFPDVQTHLVRAAQEFDRRDQARTEAVDTVVVDDTRDDRRVAAVLHRWADAHRTELGLDTGPIQVRGFHANLRHDADGYPRAQLVAEFMQHGTSDDDLGGIQPVGGATVVANGDGTVRYVVTKPIPRDGDASMRALKRHVADVEHRLGAAVWAGPVAMRVERRLHLRGLDGRR